jgi:hypothetical protein
MRTIRADKPLTMNYFFFGVRGLEVCNNLVIVLLKFGELFSLLDKAVELLQMRPKERLMSILRNAVSISLYGASARVYTKVESDERLT